MLRIFSLFLVFFAIPLSAQQALNHGDNLVPDHAPAVAPAPEPGNAVMQPGVNPPPPGTPATTHLMPAAPATAPKLAQFTISPGTIREDLTDKNVIRTTLTLTAPTMKPLLFHVESSNPLVVAFGDISVPRGQMAQNGYVTINWKKVQHNGQIQAKVEDMEHPEILLSARVYLHKKLKLDDDDDATDDIPPPRPGLVHHDE